MNHHNDSGLKSKLLPQSASNIRKPCPEGQPDTTTQELLTPYTQILSYHYKLRNIMKLNVAFAVRT